MLKPLSMKAIVAGFLFSFGFAALSSGGGAQNATVASQDLPDDMAVILNSLNREKLDNKLIESASNMSNPSSRVVVVGDSHAGRLYPPLAEWGLKNNISIEHMRIGGGCPPLLDTFVFGTDEKGDGDNCNKSGTDAILKLGNSKFDTVILVARWGMYSSNLSSLDGRVVGKENRKYKSISGDINKGYVADMTLSQQAFEAGVERTIKYFKSKGKRVIVVTQPPPVGSDFPRCVRSQPSPADVGANCFLPTYADRMDEIQWSTDALVKLSGELDFELVNSHDMFCQSRSCKVANKQGIFYLDSNHLSYVGASFLADWVEKILAPR